MKLVTYYIGDNTIEIENSILGKETVKLNGEIVSQKSSVLGTIHNFELNENGDSKEVNVKLGMSFSLGVQIDLILDNKPIIEHNRSKNRFWIILSLMLVPYFYIGYVVGKNLS